LALAVGVAGRFGTDCQGRKFLVYHGVYGGFWPFKGKKKWWHEVRDLKPKDVEAIDEKK
jgi:hypothetical protein